MKRRRLPGEGSIEELPSGRFRARVPLADGIRHDLGTHATYAEAEGVIAAALEIAAEQNVLPVGGATLRGYGPRFLDELELSRSYVAMPTARSIWRTWVNEAPFADWPLRRVTRAALKKWITQLAARADLSMSYVQQILRLVRKGLGAALDEGMVDENIAVGVTVPRQPAPTEEPWTWLTLEEQEALLGCAEIPEAWRWILGFNIDTGLRWGEQWTLHQRDVHLDVAEPHIVVRYGGRRRSKLHAPKGRRIRMVPLLPRAELALRSWLELLPTWARRNPHGLVFPGPSGGFHKVSTFPAWSEWFRAAGITRRVRPHDLRHTAGASLISGLWGRAWRLEEVRDFLGHRSIKETERYAHVAPTVLSRAAAEMRSMPIPRMAGSAVNDAARAIVGVSEGN